MISSLIYLFSYYQNTFLKTSLLIKTLFFKKPNMMQSSYIESQNNGNKVFRPSKINSSINSHISKLNFNQKNQSTNNRNSINKPIVIFKESYINQQLRKQIIQIEQCIQNYKPFLKQIKKKNKEKHINFKHELFSLEDQIKSKDYKIKNTNQQIHQLKNQNHPNTPNKQASQTLNNTPKKNPPIINCSQKENNNILFKLAEELQSQKQQLKSLIFQHKQKNEKFNQMKKLILTVQDKFIKECINKKEKPIRYEDFKELNEEKKKQMENIINKRNHANTERKVSIISKINDNFGFKGIQKPSKNEKLLNNIPSKTLKQLQNRKTVTEQALKNARKKHHHQISQLVAKVQFLRDQDMLLEQKIKQKEQQRINLQQKFNQTKSNRGSFHSRLNSHKNRLKTKNSISSSKKQLMLALSNADTQPSSPNPQINFMQRPKLNSHHSHRKLKSSKNSHDSNPYYEKNNIEVFSDYFNQ